MKCDVMSHQKNKKQKRTDQNPSTNGKIQRMIECFYLEMSLHKKLAGTILATEMAPATTSPSERDLVSY